MAILNVAQPDGGNAIFSTVIDDFVLFNSEPRFADSMEWDTALRYAIGAVMDISLGVEQAITLGLVSRETCEMILKEETT